MTALPDPAELAPTRDPAAYRRRPLLSRGFWAMIVLGALCLLAAIAVVSLGPRLAGARRAVAAAGLPPALPAASGAYTAIPPAAPTAFADAGQSAQLAALEGRVRRLEADEARSFDAAAAALAAASLSQAASGPRPFTNQLAAFERLLPRSPDALALAPLAAQGAPTRAALAAELAHIAARISVAAKAPAKGASFMAQVAYAVSRVVSVRRVDAGGAGPDAALARAERAAADGDLEGALAVLDSLPPSARDGLGDWREKARRRVQIDRRLASLRDSALADLAAAQGPRS
ncbi:MAG: hypothetical protein ABI906_04475 [Pseudomonadota bacterium]